MAQSSPPPMLAVFRTAASEYPLARGRGGSAHARGGTGGPSRAGRPERRPRSHPPCARSSGKEPAERLAEALAPSHRFAELEGVVAEPIPMPEFPVKR